ncbi:hypothetical protein AbraIFM66951_001135 [Aspergillus brasiliensis]|uniref:DUF7136 domain-containing protein n=1 Tax=Aspergillus brasiliensis TaxID=319629 RepID=A0A9W5YX43_9EURO|nr:hypothetical protein AbraCBS73388_000618 [Aspergillus brasiliensis]GKZ48889.1 hypothetical protein AbraIFM66951_001135 [Aspergillus brasiliensis]
MALLSRGCLLLALFLGFASAQASIEPGVTEVDLIFPRNESFSPSPLTPIIFAIQNPSLLSSLSPTISCHIERVDVNVNESYITSSLIHMWKLNYTTSDPYLLYWSVSKLNVEGDFVFAWELSMENCSHYPQSDALIFGYSGGFRHQLYFSTRNGTSLPDIAAATDQDACANSSAMALQVPELWEVPTSQTSSWGGPSCAPTVGPSPTPSPCKVKIDSTAAASISAALTSTACDWPFHTGLSCPTPSSKNLATSTQSPVGRLWILVIGMLLAYSLA